MLLFRTLDVPAKSIVHLLEEANTVPAENIIIGSGKMQDGGFTATPYRFDADYTPRPKNYFHMERKCASVSIESKEGLGEMRKNFIFLCVVAILVLGAGLAACGGPAGNSNPETSPGGVSGSAA